MPKRYLTRAKPALRRYQKILESSRDRDVNESDTVVVVTDFLSDVLGYDKYTEITTEHAIRGTYCDLAIMSDGQVQFLIEVKAIGKDLRDHHLRQAVDYGANEGVEWVLLTNGIEWQAHRVRFEKPIQHDLVFSVDLLEDDAKPNDLLECLYLISREAAKGDAIDTYRRRKELTNRFVLGQLLLSEPVLKLIRRELRRVAKDAAITEEEVADRLRTEVLKRDVLEGEEVKKAAGLLRRTERRRLRKAAKKAETNSDPPEVESPIRDEPE